MPCGSVKMDNIGIDYESRTEMELVNCENNQRDASDCTAMLSQSEQWSFHDNTWMAATEETIFNFMDPRPRRGLGNNRPGSKENLNIVGRNLSVLDLEDLVTSAPAGEERLMSPGIRCQSDLMNQVNTPVKIRKPGYPAYLSASDCFFSYCYIVLYLYVCHLYQYI